MESRPAKAARGLSLTATSPEQRANPVVRRRLSGPALRTFFRIADAWSLTVLEQRTHYAALRASLREHFSEEQIGSLTAEVAMINLWNRIQVSNH